MRGELGDKIERKKRQKSNMDRRTRDKGTIKNYVSNYRRGIFWELKWRHR